MKEKRSLNCDQYCTHSDDDYEKQRDSSSAERMKLTSLRFSTVAIGSVLLAAYGIGVFVIQLFYIA